MTRRLKVGIAGCGIGAQHLKAYRQFRRLYAVEAICDIDGEKARAFAREHRISQVVTAFDALLGLDLDIIDICTPSALHFGQARDALRAGRHVVVEKPLASSLAEADLLARLERRSPGRLCPIFQYRFGDGIAELLHLRDEGFAGKAYAATIETHWRRLPDYYANPWRGRWASELGGCLVTHAIHNHDLLTMILGPIRSVYARTATRVNPIETEDCAALVLQMRDGSFATLSVTLGAEEDMSRLRFCFAGLTAESSRNPYGPGAAPWRFVAADAERQAAVDAAAAEVAPAPEGYAGQFRRMHRALVDGGPLPVTVADSRASLEFITAAYHSARTGKAVKLPIGRDHPLYEGWFPKTAARKRQVPT